MPALKIRIAKADRPFYGDGTLAQGVKVRLSEALTSLDKRSAPVHPSLSVPCESVTVWISDEQQALINQLGREHQIEGSGPVATGLLHAWASEELRSTHDDEAPVTTGALTTLDIINQSMGDRTRVDQAKFFHQLVGEVMADRPAHEVIFAEASTGVGKSRAFLALVLDWCAAHPDGHAVVAAPSYSVLLQILHQWHRIASVHDVPDIQVLVGQQEIVSQHALEGVLLQHPDTPGAEQARQWLAGGGQAPADDPMGHRWLARSLQVVTDGAWTLFREVALGPDVADDDAGMLAYRGQFKDAREASVVFCTHAMLAVEVRFRATVAAKGFNEDNEGTSIGKAAWEAWQARAKEGKGAGLTWELRNDLLQEQVHADVGRLPQVGLLIVDEAHLLEQAFAQVFAHGASMARLMSMLQRIHDDAPKVVRAQDLDTMRSLWVNLKEVGAATGKESIPVSKNEVLAEAITTLRQLISGVLSRMKGKNANRREAPQLKAMKLAMEIAARTSDDAMGMTTRVSWSPSVHWPSIEVGRYDVSRELDFLWTLVVQERSVLVSATLYEDVSRAGVESMRRMLSVRSSLLRTLVPVRPAWLYEPVTLCLVGDTTHGDGVPRFRRPAQSDRLEAGEFAVRMDRWRDDVATYIQTAYASAAGGVLVLLTSHAEREELVERLASVLPAQCLLTQDKDLTMDRLRLGFLRLVAAGKRPCLLVVGAGWTGLDISGDGLSTIVGKPVPAGEDNVLTDLIIPTSPIGTNRSLTHEWRRERSGMMAEVGATCIMFRQGVGRLVRREGLPHNRRLHFLDARIHESKWQWVLRPMVRTLSRYAKRRTV